MNWPLPFRNVWWQAMWLWMLIVNSVLSQMLTEKQLNNTEVPYLLTDISMQCPEGWEIEGNKCYRLYPTEKSWPQALIFCGRYGAKLARIESEKENTFVSRLISRPHRSATIARSAHWIGLAVGERGAAADGDDARFLWSDGSAASRYIGRWARNQPRFSDGRCTIAGLDGRTELEWQLAMCNRLLPFVCELPACVSGSFFCHNGKCIPESAHCNGINECNDFSDELNCPAAHSDANCLRYERGESGKIETPNFPSSYRSNLNCRWVLEGPVNSRLTLTFDTFETEENADLVTILDGGPAENSTLVIDTLSGSPASSQLSVTSSTNMLIVRFRSDATVQARGFQATWRANTFSCGGALKAQMYSQTFSSPRPYPAGGECAWRIESTPGQVISLNIETFDIEAKKDFLIIYDGAQPSSPVLAKLTGAIQNQLLISTQNHLYIYFYSNYAHAAKGFTISYKKGCDNTIQYTHGALLSPGHMSVPYPNVQTCKYTIELPENKAAQPIAIAINHFDVEEDDFLKIYEGDESGRALHEGQGFSEHRRPPKRVYSQQGKATIVFNSNALKNALGWNLTFSTNCPTLKAPNNVFFSSQNTAFGTKVVVTCKPGHEFTNGIGQRFEMICELGGRWTEDFIPQCQPIYCGAVPQIANGFAVSATNVTFGGMAKYECYDGFSFPSGKKSEEVRCGDDGWSKPPKCKAESCSALPQFQNGKRSLRFGDGNGFGTVYQFACDDGFRLVGAPTILCRSNGDWSAEQPNCKKLICPIIPAVKNGRIVVSGGRLEFGDTARVECSVGFRITGPEVVHCLANQTLSSISECRDLDECVEDLAICTAKSTSCVNLEGGYACQCLNGFKPQLNCPSYVSLTPVKVETTSSHIANLTHLTYCADPTDTERQVTFTFAAPKVLERIRFEKLNGGMPMIISISYANDTRGRFHTNANLTKIEMKNVDVAGSQVVVLREAVEIQMLQITIHEFKQNPCTKIELLGCQKSSCIDVNECETENGFCDHNCHNFQGGYKCSCNEGYNLFAVDGQGGVSLKDGETGLSNLDTVRFNKTCIPTRCPPISSPENGQIVSAIGDFQFPTVLEFKCRFGYQIRGPRFLKCTTDGTWKSNETHPTESRNEINGTIPIVPTCTPAVCEGIQNNTAIGMFVSSSSTFVPYGENVTFVCTQQNRPARSSPLGNVRQCIYDPQPNGVDYSLAGPIADCPLVDCGPPPAEPGAFYEGEENNFKVGSAFGFNCRPPYSLIGKSSYDDRIVRCNVDGSFDLGDLRCSGPVCVDPGNPDEGRTYLNSVEEGAIARFTCNRPGYRPFPHDTINCTLGTPCLLSEDVGISTGFIPDGAFTDSDTKTTYGYEPHKARLSSTGWCGSKDAFIFLSVDLQRIYTLTTLRFAGVAGSGHLKGHVTKLQLFYKVQFSQNYDSYPIEFETEPGNHNRLYQFQLNPPVRARYILLGVTEYEDNPCLRFDMFGCLAPLSSAHEIPSHLQVGWNASVPQCIDAEPPIFKNCPINPIFAQIDEFGQLLPVSYEIPFAVDNSGSIAHIRVEPKDFRPPYPIHEPIDVHYTAFDNAGNSAECVVQLRVPDTQPPAMKCPDSYAIHAKPNETERHVNFNETSVNLVIHDASNVTEIRIRPSDATIRLHSHVDVEVTATDVHSNQNSCKFQVALTPEPCAEWALRTDDSTVIKKCVKRAKGTACTLKCKPGYRFVNGSSVEPSELQFTCSGDNSWLPNANPPDCVAVAQEPARYELNVAIDYTSTVMPSVECMKSYGESVSSHFDSIGQTLTQRCSSSVQVFVRLLDVNFQSTTLTSNSQVVRANYTVQILPTVLQEVFYELCGLTLKTIFDLRIPGATLPIKSLLSLLGGSFNGPACPSMNATSTTISQGFSCTKGEILRLSEEKVELPECVPCGRGTAFVNNTCVACPAGSFQDREGQMECRACPEGTHTDGDGAQSKSQCLAVCGYGMYSESGLIPCRLCPRHTFSGAPIPGGFKQCESCPENMFTANLGSTSQSQCKKPCREGHFSATGLEPCSACPVNYYQSSLGQQRCIECPNNTITHESGRSLETECRVLDCTGVKCQNKGTCTVDNHQVICECRPGFQGRYCEEQVPLCNTKPCLNGGTCETAAGTFRCICPQTRCQFGPDECIGVKCPNGGVCQDLPGLGTTKCICRSGFTGVDCSEISDPCQSDNPCKNGADCVPLQLGRYKCKCLPGWEGENCERNVDDCKNNPCALGAICHDLINDFECECPQGFEGKRCHIKEDLCNPDPCLNGQCVDTLFDRKCLCSAGWTGAQCEQKIDNCANQCKNNATCKDQDNGFICQCSSGFYGVHCQHMVDHCAASPCANNGICTNLGPTFHCDCPIGFEGLHCEVNVNECETARIKCSAEGTELCEDQVNGFTCQCRAGYTGVLCETHLNQCEAEPCLNNGTCVDLGSTFRCDCPSAWRGERCEREAGQCEKKPCQNGGQCVPMGDDYFCVCPEGVSGRKCEIAPNRCIAEPCLNGGVCGDFGARHECTCQRGFVGDGCQYELDPCHRGQCKNGATCVPDRSNGQESGYRCLCAPGYTGVDCEADIDECQPNPCPLAATCVDQVGGGHFCRCAFNMTGPACDKRIDPDYDVRFNDGIIGARAALSIPFHFASGAFSLSFWVRFDTPSGKGDVLTLYHSQSSNGPNNLTELLRVSADSVRLALFAEDTPLTLHFPPNQRLNDGEWNNLIITWTAHEGAYSLVWNAIRLYADVGYAKNKQLDINAWINLGQLVDSSDYDARFIGSITRVHMWSKILDFESEIPSIVSKCQEAPVLYNGLVLHFANYDRLYGNVEKITRSTCGRLTTEMMRMSSLKQRDVNAVQVEQCPSDIFVVTPLKEINVTWQEPIFSSANPIDRIEKNLKPGQIFTFGEFMVLYVAYDNESNIAECTFKVHVSREFCPEIPNPVNGMQSCESWGPNLKYQACSIQCESGYEFSEKPAVFYTCAEDGIWQPRPENSFTFRYPQCSKKTPAKRVVQVSVHYPAVTICNEASRTTLSDRLLQRIHQLNHKWKLCADTGADDQCSGAEVRVNCLSNQDEPNGILKRHRRQTSSELFSVQLEVPVKRSDTPIVINGEKPIDAVELIQSEVLLRDLLNLEQVLPNGRPDLNSFKIEDDYQCAEGEVTVEESCVPCASGSYFNHASKSCQYCGIGKYQPSQGQTSCLSCARNGVTTSPGAIAVDECKPRCEPGHFFNLTNGMCEECDYGFYQPQDGMFSCIACGIGKTTLEKTARSEEECRDECGDGEYLTQAGNCQACEIGTYRTKGSSRSCQQCPPGTTTESVRSLRRSDCNTPKCVPGQFLVVATKTCHFCPRGTHQDQALQTTCKNCPIDHTTASAGATHESQCYSTNQCATGENNCSWHAVCIDLPDDHDIPTFQCRCKPGFRGNGTHCMDACTNFCLNDGVCKKNQIGFAECLCKENFSGERCDIRFQPRSQKVAFVTMCIGGVVLLLILIVVVIWLIGYRFKRADRISTLMDKSGLGNFESPLHSNFIYGRAERAESTTMTHGVARPVGFYYEEDTDGPYDSSEVKTMFVGGGVSSSSREDDEAPDTSQTDDSQRHSPKDVSETANLRPQEESEERLQRMRHHMYQSSGLNR